MPQVGRASKKTYLVNKRFKFLHSNMAAMNFSEGTTHEITIVNVANLTTIVSYLIFGIVNLLCLLVNLKVLHVVIVSLPQRRKRQDLASLLIAQLSLISIVLLAVGILNVGDRVGFIKQRGQLLCCVMGFLRSNSILFCILNRTVFYC